MLLSRTPDLSLSVSTKQSRTMDIARHALLALAGSLFVALCAHVAVPLSLTPVPVTLQPFAVLLVGMLLGPGVGFTAMVLYLCEGAAGLPVFTPYGLPGVARLVGPTGGYLFADPIAAAVAGGLPLLFKLNHRRFIAYVVAGAVGMLLIYGSGAWWFVKLLHLPLTAVLAQTVQPFLLLDTVKVLAAAAIASVLQLRDTRA